MKKILIFAVIGAFAFSSILTGYAKSGVKWMREVAVKAETQLAAQGTTENKVEAQIQTTLEAQEQVQAQEPVKEQSQEGKEEAVEEDKNVDENSEETPNVEDGKKVDLQPVIKENNTLIPVKAIARGLDAKVAWDPDTKTLTVIKGDKTIQYTLGDSKALVNGVEVTIDKKMNENATFVPIKFFSEVLGEKHDKKVEKVKNEDREREKKNSQENQDINTNNDNQGQSDNENND